MKIKSNLKRTVSVLLAVMLLAATAIPMTLFTVGADAAVDAAVEAVKTAWGKVKGERIPLNFAYYAQNEQADPAVIYTVGDDNSPLFYFNSVHDLPDTITAEEFGEGYHKINVDESNIYFTRSAFRYSYPDTLTSNGITIGDIDSIDFCYKMDTLANYGNKYFEIGFNHRGIWFVDARRKTALIDNNTDWNHMVYKIDDTANWQDGSWKDKDGNAIGSSTVASTALKKDQYFYISLSNNIVNTNFYIGGVFLQLKPQIPDISSMSALDIIREYYKTDFSKYTNTEALAAAITDLCAAMGDGAVDIVKDAVATAWNNVKGERIKLDFDSYYDSDRAEHTEADSVLTINALAPTDSGEADLANGYYKASIPAVETINHGNHTAFSFVATDRTIDASKIDTLSFWAKKYATVATYPALWVAVNSASWESDANVKTLDTLESGGYVGGSSNLVNSTWTHFTIGAALFGQVTEGTTLTNIVLSCMNTSAALDLSVGGVYITLKAPSLTEGADEANILQTYYASDWTGCTNTEALDAAITNLCAAIGETKVQEQQAIVAVKKAYNADSAFTADNSVWNLKTALKNADKLVAKNETAYKDLFNDVLGFYGAEKITKYDCTFDNQVDICDLVTAWAYTNSEKVDIFTYALKDETGVIPDGVCNTIRTDLLN